MLKINDVNKKIGNKLILGNISFQVKEGDFIGIIGPHNSGKSTLMDILAGVARPTSGNVEYNYQNIFDISFQSSKSQIGYAPQYFDFYPNMKVYEFLDYVCILKDICNKKTRILEVERLLDVFEMQSIRGKLIKNLSRSNRQKLKLCQALVGNPKVVLLDEPTLGLDALYAARAREILKSELKDRIVIVSSYVLPEVTAMCNEIIVMDNGKIVANDQTKKLSKDYCQRNVLLISTTGNPDKIKYLFENYDEVLDISIINKDDRDFDIKLELKKDTDIRKEVFQKLSSLHMPIHKMTLQPLTLEELYSRLDIFDAVPVTVNKKGKVIDIKTKKITSVRGNNNDR